jgi:hypothetical protein
MAKLVNFPLCSVHVFDRGYVENKWQLSNMIYALCLHLFAKIKLNQFINKPFEKESIGSPQISNRVFLIYLKRGKNPIMRFYNS